MSGYHGYARETAVVASERSCWKHGATVPEAYTRPRVVRIVPEAYTTLKASLG